MNEKNPHSLRVTRTFTRGKHAHAFQSLGDINIFSGNKDLKVIVFKTFFKCSEGSLTFLSSEHLTGGNDLRQLGVVPRPLRKNHQVHLWGRKGEVRGVSFAVTLPRPTPRMLRERLPRLETARSFTSGLHFKQSNQTQNSNGLI